MLYSKLVSRSSSPNSPRNATRRAGGPPMSREQEHALVRAVREHDDPASRQRLWLATVGFVHRHARRLTHRSWLLDDLIQTGLLSQHAVVTRFDPARGTRLITYAAIWTRYSQGKCLRQSRSVVKPAAPDLSLDPVLRREWPPLDASLDNWGMRRHLRPIIEKLLPSTEIDCFDPPGRPIDYLLSRDPNPEEALVAKQQRRFSRAVVRLLLPTLPSREALILRERFLRPDDTSPSLEELGTTLGISRERVRQLEIHGLQLLRQGLHRLVGRSGRRYRLRGADKKVALPG